MTFNSCLFISLPKSCELFPLFHEASITKEVYAWLSFQSIWTITFYYLSIYLNLLLHHLMPQLEILLMVEKLKELRSLRIQKLKKQGIYLKYTLPLVSCAVIILHIILLLTQYSDSVGFLFSTLAAVTVYKL